jgi:2'-5' RNA ligase
MNAADLSLLIKEASRNKSDWGWVAVNAPTTLSRALRRLQNEIDNDDIYDEPGFGIEKDHHCTIAYGLGDNVQPNRMKLTFALSTPVTFRVEDVSTFDQDDHVVLKYAVKSGEISYLRRRVREDFGLPGNTYPRYNPHITIAYLKKGADIDKYKKKFSELVGRSYTSTKAVYDPKGWGKPWEITIGRDRDADMKKAAEEDIPLSLLTAVPADSLESVLKHGVLSQKAMLDNEDALIQFIKQRAKDMPEEDWDEEAEKEHILKALKEDKHAVKGPSAFFTDPDPEKVSDPRHYINRFNTKKLKIDLEKLLEDEPDTKIMGVELKPWPEDQEEEPEGRQRELTVEDIKELIARGPEDLWKDYYHGDDENPYRYYAAHVPHAIVMTPSGKIDPKYLSLVEDLVEDKEAGYKESKQEAAEAEDTAPEGKCWRVLWADGRAHQCFRRKSHAQEFWDSGVGHAWFDGVENGPSLVKRKKGWRVRNTAGKFKCSGKDWDDVQCPRCKKEGKPFKKKKVKKAMKKKANAGSLDMLKHWVHGFRDTCMEKGIEPELFLSLNNEENEVK